MRVEFILDIGGVSGKMIWEDGWYNEEFGSPKQAIECTLEHALEVNAVVSLTKIYEDDTPTTIDIVTSPAEQTQEVKRMYADTLKKIEGRIKMCAEKGCEKCQVYVCHWTRQWGKCKQLTEQTERL